MLIGDIMIDHWREIEKVLDRNLMSEGDKAKILDAYKALCWHWCDDAASLKVYEEKLESDFPEYIKDGPDMLGKLLKLRREQWPDEWSVCGADYCEL